jgi:hypothetical protein
MPHRPDPTSEIEAHFVARPRGPLRRKATRFFAGQLTSSQGRGAHFVARQPTSSRGLRSHYAQEPTSGAERMQGNERGSMETWGSKAAVPLNKICSILRCVKQSYTILKAHRAWSDCAMPNPSMY